MAKKNEAGTASPRLLVVQRVGSAPLSLDIPDAIRMEYYFTDEPSPDGFSAWQVEEAGNCYSFAVRTVCQGFDGGFRLQALNRYFARIVQKHRIEKVLVRDCHGCTLDLVRMANLMHIPALLKVPLVNPLSAAVDSSTGRLNSDVNSERITHAWFSDSLGRAEVLLHEGAHSPAWLGNVAREVATLPVSLLAEYLAAPDVADNAEVDDIANYAIYEFTQRDHPLLMQMQAREVCHFTDCRRVLDIGCGAGIFLQLLLEAGVSARGVERDPVIAAYGRGMGLDIVTADALDYLLQAGEQATLEFDGIYCSHFVEHLPVDLVHTLMDRAALLLPPGGILVLTFPDPESIRAQLLGFWRDPEHVRFYHPELVTTMARAHGFDLEWSSYQEQPHEVVPFALVPPSIPVAEDKNTDVAALPPIKGKWWHRLLTMLRLVSAKDHQVLAQRIDELQAQLTSTLRQHELTIAALIERTDQLWSVNRTWAWNDNVVLKLRRRG